MRHYICQYFHFVGSKRVFQENKARQIFRKTNISYPLIRTRTCAYQGVRMFFFRKIWHALFSWNTRFQIRPFTLLLTICKQFITFWMTVVIFWAQLNKQNNEHFFRFYNLKNWHWRKVTPNKKILEIIREVWVIKKAKLRESFLRTCNLLPVNHFSRQYDYFWILSLPNLNGGINFLPQTIENLLQSKYIKRVVIVFTPGTKML